MRIRSLRPYVRLWLLLTFALTWEWYALNHNSFVSFFALLKENVAAFAGLNLTPAPGKTISLWYGWTGFTLMLLTNPYILRKRLGFLAKLGSLPGWLNFHIFCGLLGPTFIVFHSNFKVGGLVAISFWSMMVSFTSGIVGRYFYVQLGAQRGQLEQEASASEAALKQYWESTKASEDSLGRLKAAALKLAGARAIEENLRFPILFATFSSLLGDLRLRFGLKRLAGTLPDALRADLKKLAVTRRRIGYLEQFQAIMSYWHTFHMPFAVFMYVVAAIHIVTGLFFRVV